MVIDNYLVCYIVDPDKVTVTDVLYGASNVHARLKADIRQTQTFK